MIYESDIPKELEIGQVYTGRQISSFITSNKNSVIMGDESSYFHDTDSNKYTVTHAYEKYLHKQDFQSGSYMIPNSKTKFYIIEKA